MTDKDLKEMLRLHENWVEHKEDGVRADLSNMDLDYADLSGANLSRAILSKTRLNHSNLSNANLFAAEIDMTNLLMADLSYANLTNSFLHMTDMGYAILKGTNFTKSRIVKVSLRNVVFSKTIINWTSHDLVSEILLQAAGQNSNGRSIAGLVRCSEDWCWDDFLAIEHPAKQWALEVLETYLLPGDTCYWKDIVEKR